MLLKGDLEGRLDAQYYIPTIVELENKIRAIAKGITLKNFALKMSSGATPLKSEEEKYYSDSENGIPFIRVQNLSPTNELMLNDLKYINLETHETSLKRSQVSENDLLVKITGVGRMAIACVPPKNFIGNTNQHLVVIKTQDRETSEAIATYLNTDIAEKLATRRSTGGTRPALDYTSIKSLPIILKPAIIDVMKIAVEAYNCKDADAKIILNGVDDYLLKSLGISFQENVETKLVSYINFRELQGKRLDPFYYDLKFHSLENSVKKGKYPLKNLESLCIFVASGKTPPKSEYSDEVTDYPIVKAGSYTRDCINLDKTDFVKSKHSNIEVQINDIFILAAAHQAEYVGKKVYILEDLPSKTTSYVGELLGIRANKDICNAHYLFSLLKSDLFLKLLNREKRGQTSHLYPHDVKKIQIPLPPLSIQNEIANHIQSIRNKARALENEAKEILEQAKAEVERMILGE
jgi:restriction endonuclease S subunit